MVESEMTEQEELEIQIYNTRSSRIKEDIKTAVSLLGGIGSTIWAYHEIGVATLSGLGEDRAFTTLPLSIAAGLYMYCGKCFADSIRLSDEEKRLINIARKNREDDLLYKGQNYLDFDFNKHKNRHKKRIKKLEKKDTEFNRSWSKGKNG